MLKNALQYSHQLLKEVIQPGDIVVDATMGNGYDTLFLAQLVKRHGHVFAFDVQEQALLNTQKRLSDNKINNVTLVHDTHAKIEQYIDSNKQIKGAIFNLGYLPTTDKKIITKPESTKKALNQLLPQLIVGGRIVIVAYWGHPGGLKELEMIQTYCYDLAQEKYNVLMYQFINQQNKPPILFCIERIKEKPLKCKRLHSKVDSVKKLIR